MALNDLVQLIFRLLGALRHVLIDYARQNPWAIVAALYGMALAFGVTIQSGQRGVLFRWGRVVKELEPGFHWLLPLVHTVRKTPVRSVTIHLPDQKVMTADGLVYDVRANVVYRVQDATKALTLVDHIDAGCRAAIPIIVTDVVRVRDQAQLVDRVSLDHELSERMHAWVARWGLVVEQAGFTTIAPSKGVLHTTQLRSKTMERARALHTLIGGGLDAESALVMIGSERQPVAKSSRRYHRRTGRPGRQAGARYLKDKAAAPSVVAKSPNAAASPEPTATETLDRTSSSSPAVRKRSAGRSRR